MKLLKSTLVVLSFSSLIACSIPVDKAIAPSNPPEVKATKFSATAIEGHYEGLLNTKFFWPTARTLEDEVTHVPLSFDEQVSSRQKIVRLLEEKAYFKKQLDEATIKINKKYEELKTTYKEEYKSKKCYALCDPEDLFCEPDVSDKEEHEGGWNPNPTPEEAETIALCKVNLEKMENVDSDKEKELKPYENMYQQVGKALVLETNLDRRFKFGDFLKFEFIYGSQACAKVYEARGAVENCVSTNEKPLYLRLSYTDTIVSNLKSETPDFLIRDVVLDPKGGFLAFVAPALDFEDGVKQTGDLYYDLEFNNSSGLLRVDGDMVLKNKSEFSGKVGRFFSEGVIQQ